MTAKGVTLDQLVNWHGGYSEIGGCTVVDQTGLGGTYDFTLRWTRERLTAPPPQSGQPGATPPPEPESPALLPVFRSSLASG